MKKIILSLILIFCLFVACHIKVDAATEKLIDIYLIGGQSNAVGYSYSVNQAGSTYSNVMYAGEIEERFREDNGQVSRSNIATFDDFNKNVTIGLGASKSHTGPEYGMASVINDSLTSNHKALIFKYAAGGTSLLDNTQELSSAFGNWYPRSLWEKGYTPDIEHCYDKNDATGLLYYAFVKKFEHVYNILIEEGYTPVIKGMAWMQGETNLYPASTFNEYRDVLKVFIKDIREDIYNITGNLDDLAMPFVIGKIATSFGGWANPAVPGFNNIQEQIAEMDDKVACIETSDLIIVGEDGNIVGSDLYHFNFKDQVTLGQRFMNKLSEINDNSILSIYIKNGQYALTEVSDGNKVLHMEGENHYYLSKFEVNGIDNLSSVQNGTFNIPNAKNVIIKAEYTELTKHQITYSLNTGKGGGLRFTPYSIYESELLSLKLYVNEGYKIKKFTFNGNNIEYNDLTGYYETTVFEDGEVVLELEKIKAEDPIQPPVTPPTKKSGCGKGCYFIVLLVATIPFCLRKREN